MISCPKVAAAEEEALPLRKWFIVEALLRLVAKMEVVFSKSRISKSLINISRKVFSLIKIDLADTQLVLIKVKTVVRFNKTIPDILLRSIAACLTIVQ